MTTVTAHVPTPNAGKYVQQLCKHWGHKLDVQTEGNCGTIRFPDGVGRMDAHADGLVLTISGEDPEAVERLKGVFERHIDRFAFREAPLTYTWS